MKCDYSITAVLSIRCTQNMLKSTYFDAECSQNPVGFSGVLNSYNEMYIDWIGKEL